MIESLKFVFLNLLKNTNISLYKTHTSRLNPFQINGLIFPPIRLSSGSMGVDVTVHQMVSVRYELGANSSRALNVQVNLNNLICKIKNIKNGKSIPNFHQQNLSAIEAQQNLVANAAQQNLVANEAQKKLSITFVEKVAVAFEFYRTHIIVLSWVCIILEALYKDTNKPGYYCNVKIPAGQSINELFEFRKEFLLPTKFINSDNFCEKLSETSSFNLQPIDVYENFVKFQSVCIKIFIPLGQICMRLIIVIPVVNVVNEAIFVGFLQIRTKTYFGIIATGIVSFFVSYGIVDNVYNMSIFVTSKTFNVISFTIKHIVRIIQSDKVEID